jgi:hypothetical protein
MKKAVSKSGQKEPNLARKRNFAQFDKDNRS